MLSVAQRRSATAQHGIDPINLLPWHSVFWADGPRFRKRAIADGSTVDTWDDDSGNGRDATQGVAGNRPTFRAAVAAFGGRPTVEFPNLKSLATASFTSLAAPMTVVFVAGITSQVDGTFYVFYDDSSAVHATYTNATPTPDTWTIDDGTAVNGGDADSVAHCFIALHNTTSSTLKVDGVTVASGNSGTNQLAALVLGRNRASTAFLQGHMPFLGLVNRALTSWEEQALICWSKLYYRTP